MRSPPGSAPPPTRTGAALPPIGSPPARVVSLDEGWLMPSVLTLLLSAAAMVGTVPPPVWLWPLDGPHTITRPYVAPLSPYGRGHRGVDLAAPEGAVVRAPAGGVVHFVGFVVDRPVISLRHADGVLSSFEPVASDLRRGDRVEAGEGIGTLLAGHCGPDQPCLHLGARYLGQYLSPLKYLGGIPRPVLLPTRRYADPGS